MTYGELMEVLSVKLKHLTVVVDSNLGTQPASEFYLEVLKQMEVGLVTVSNDDVIVRLLKFF